MDDDWMRGGRHTRRSLLRGLGAGGLLAGLESVAPLYAWSGLGSLAAPSRSVGEDDVYELTIARAPVEIGSRVGSPITINGSIPGPMIRLREGRNAVLRVTNRLPDSTSIHWHGILLPPEMDGVPGVSFAGIAPGETFEYRYPVRQSGTYWYHSHTGLQEQLGHYGPLVLEPAEPEPFGYERDYVVVLSDWTFDDPHDVFRKLKVAEGYFNYNQRTVGDFFRDVETMGWGGAWRKAAMWGRMRMSPRDILDVTGSEYTYLMNGLPSVSNWTGLFRAGERVRLRFINASAMTFFDVRIPGLAMTVVQADGQNVRPVETDEFRIGVAETYDVLVQPAGEPAYTIFAEAIDRSGAVRGTLAVRPGLSAPVPALRPRPERGMESMGMDHGAMGEGHGSMSGGKGHGAMHGGAGGMMDKGHGAMHGGAGGTMDKGHGAMHGGGATAVPTARRRSR